MVTVLNTLPVSQPGFVTGESCSLWGCVFGALLTGEQIPVISLSHTGESTNWAENLPI